MAGSLPQKLPIEQMQPQWAAQLNPILSNPLVGGQLLTDVLLKSGNNTINHGLGRKLQGWILVGISAAITLFDNQNVNPSPQLTLILNSSGTATVNLWVF